MPFINIHLKARSDVWTGGSESDRLHQSFFSKRRLSRLLPPPPSHPRCSPWQRDVHSKIERAFTSRREESGASGRTEAGRRGGAAALTSESSRALSTALSTLSTPPPGLQSTHRRWIYIQSSRSFKFWLQKDRIHQMCWLGVVGLLLAVTEPTAS